MVDDVARLAPHLPAHARRVVVVGGTAVATALRGLLPTADVVAVAPGAGLHLRLTALPQADLLVDASRGDLADRWPLLTGHVRRGGSLLALLPRRPGPRTAVLDLVADVDALASSDALDPPARRPDPRPAAERDRHALAATLEEVVVDADVVRADVAVATWRVVPERRVDRLLETTAALGRVVTHRPAATWRPTTPLRDDHPDPAVADADGTVSAPPLALREHDDVLVAPRLVAVAGEVVLPQSFRDPTRRRPSTPTLTDWLPGSVRVPTELDGVRPPALAGTWFHADAILPGHFGHALTEQLSQLWAWPEVLARHPDAGLLLSTGGTGGPAPGWLLELLAAAGVTPERVRAIDGPVRVERLLAATPAYVIGRHLHPVLRGLHRAVGDALAVRSTLDPGTLLGRSRRLFLTRSGTKRACRNQAEVEARFVAAGFAVVAPERLPLPDQVAIVRAAEELAGFAGSGLFHLALADRPTPLTAITHTGYHVWNERALAALHGHPLTVLRGEPEVAAPARGFSEAAFHSAYRLDLDAVADLLPPPTTG